MILPVKVRLLILFKHPSDHGVCKGRPKCLDLEGFLINKIQEHIYLINY